MNKIIIIDDHSLFVSGLKELLVHAMECEIVTFTSALDFLNSDEKGDVIITDIEMPNMNGMELIETLKKESDCPPILVISMHKKYAVINKSLTLGVEGYILKEDADTELIKAVLMILNGEKYYSSNVLTIKNTPPEIINKLTPREIQILKLIAFEKNNRNIAEDLFISLETVKTHRKNLKKKMNVTTTHELINYAIEYIM